MKTLISLLVFCVAAIHLNAQSMLDSLLEESYKAYSYYLFEDAIELANDAAEYAKVNADSSGWMRAQFYREIAFQVRQGDAYNIDTILTFRHYFEAKQLKEEEARAYLHLARIYYYFGDVQNEIGQYFAALDLYEQTGNARGKAAVYSDMSLMYYDQQDYDAAFEYIRKAIAIDKETANPKKLHRDYNNLAIIFEHTGPIDSAIAIHRQALDYGYQSGEPYSIGLSLSNLGNNYAMNQQFDLAKKYLSQALHIRDSIGNHRGLAYTNVRLGYMALQMNELNAAQRYADDALHHAEKTNELKIKRMSYRLQADVAEVRNDCEQELYYVKQVAALEDSIRNSDNTKEITKIMMQHEFAQQSFADSAAHFAESLRLKNEFDKEIIKQHNLRNVAMICGVFALLLAFGLYRRSQYVKKANQKLQVEKDRSENLLLNILPEEIAQELKEKGKADARDFEMVSIIFTDFKGFTEQSAKLSAAELVKEINTCFEAFDGIMEKYGIEKIKTIGDAYMAAGGLPVPTDDSVKNTVLAALEMQQFIINRKNEVDEQALSPSGGGLGEAREAAFEMRVGIHTGPVVAGIVGVKKFQYDIWGDTVNTASRMESSGEVGKVNISQATYELLKDASTSSAQPALSLSKGGGISRAEFVFEPRGKIQAKGKGEMEMWFVQLKNK